MLFHCWVMFIDSVNVNWKYGCMTVSGWDVKTWATTIATLIDPASWQCVVNSINSSLPGSRFDKISKNISYRAVSSPGETLQRTADASEKKSCNTATLNRGAGLSETIFKVSRALGCKKSWEVAIFPAKWKFAALSFGSLVGSQRFGLLCVALPALPAKRCA